MIGFLFGGGLLVAVVAALWWVINNPDKAEKVFGWLATAISKIWHKADRAAVAWSVAGQINDASATLLESAPEGLIQHKIKIKWTGADEAEALLREGEVLVCMEKAEHQERNVANALMAFLPKTMLTHARRYLDGQRMRAADLIVAKGLLDQDGSKPGALDVFYSDHLDPARNSGKDLCEKIDELDAIDLQGWLVRVLLAEYLRLGVELHPGEPDPEVLREAEEFARWLHDISAREPGTEVGSLNFKGRYFRVAVIFVGIKAKLADEGLKPYRKRAKRYIYRDEYDAIYLMARDDNMVAVEALAQNLESDGRVADVATYRYPLRADFKTRYGLNRDRSIISCVRRRRIADPLPDEVEKEFEDGLDPGELPEETYETTPPKLDVPLFDEANQPHEQVHEASQGSRD
jgi:hypothetical protein